MAASTMTPPVTTPSTPTVDQLTEEGIDLQAPNSNVQAGKRPLAPLNASSVQVNLTESPRDVPALDDPIVASSSVCTDHMVTVSWNASTGWETPQIKPYGPLSLMPTASVLHYATECFEGLKLYRGYDNKLRFFRIGRNCARMRNSANRIALPTFESEELVKLILALAKIDGPKWLPKDTHKGKFLYCRPTLISDDASLGVQRPVKALLFVILTMFPDMSDPKALEKKKPAASDVATEISPTSTLPQSNEVQGLKLLASSEETIRAWPGGFGYAKLGANYGPSLVAQGVARDRGFNQILWLFGAENYVTEAGASNFFIVMKNKESGAEELITAGLEDKVILEGVTRASILQLVEERLPELKIVERKFTMMEIKEAMADGRVVEAFAAGTAFFVAPVGLIEWKDEQMRIPTVKGHTGKYARQLRAWLSGIMYGEEQHEWGVVVEED
ncbi:hypothetical protein MBLNU457_7098t1 [Dothideomycetes sp. NU457]